MKKSELKNRMVVRLRNGDLCMVIDNVLITHDPSFFRMGLSVYNDDMTSKKIPNNIEHGADIMEVYGVCDYLDIYRFVSLHDPIWKREKEPIEVTLEDIENKFGCKVKIVKGEEE